MAGLLFGVETEYAIAGVSPAGEMDREQILQRMMALGRQRLVHLTDLNAPSGFFVQNGSRFYVDCGSHPEICTPECANPWDAVRYIQAGHRILGSLASAVEFASLPGTEIVALRCNVDYSGSRNTWGCHESYMHRIPQDALQPQIVPHLVTRLIYTGAGGFNPLSRGLEFTLSPRMAHFRRVVTVSSTSERGIWHTKSEPLCAGYRRLHVICGESLCSETANFLKVGVTALIVAMADAGLTPGSAVQLADPLAAMQRVASDAACKAPLRMADGSLMTAIAIQRHYLEAVEAHLGASFMPERAAEVCRRWRAVLDQLEDAPAGVEKTLDWGIKRALYANYARSLGIRWDMLPFLSSFIEQAAAVHANCKDGQEPVLLEYAIAPKRRIPRELAALEPMLRLAGLGWDDVRAVLNSRQKFFEIDTRFGQLGVKGIFETLDRAGVLNHRVAGVDAIDRAMTEPPASGRARIRGEVVRRLASSANVRCDWESVVNFGDGQILDLSDPFAGEESWKPIASADDSSSDREIWPDNSHDPYMRRQDAADRILSGDYAGAEVLLRGLLAETFMLPSTHCHMARVLLMTNREAQAREHIAQAWAIRNQASRYVVPRILFFQCIFAIFDGTAIGGIVGQIRAALHGEDAHLDWTILPMLDHLRPRLGEANYEFLKALAHALSDSSAMRRLDEFPQWLSAVAAAA
ncbi:MAG: proteasome accessory factor PafA2 family protein [Terracidiphilus sp.]|jgi:hypothetical protein